MAKTTAFVKYQVPIPSAILSTVAVFPIPYSLFPYSKIRGIPSEGLTKRNGFDHPPLVSWDSTSFPNTCSVRFPSNSSVAKGNFSVSVQDCDHSAQTFDCFVSPFATSCASFFTHRGRMWAATQRLLINEQAERSSSNVPPLRIGEDTLAVIVRIVDQLLATSAWLPFVFAVHQAVPNQTLHSIQGTGSVTEISGRLFWPSAASICFVLISCCSLGLLSAAVMLYNKTHYLQLVFSPEDVARLATTEPGKRHERKAWYLKLHPIFPYITVSTDSEARSEMGRKRRYQ